MQAAFTAIVTATIKAITDNMDDWYKNKGVLTQEDVKIICEQLGI